MTETGARSGATARALFGGRYLPVVLPLLVLVGLWELA